MLALISDFFRNLIHLIKTLLSAASTQDLETLQSAGVIADDALDSFDRISEEWEDNWSHDESRR